LLSRLPLFALPASIIFAVWKAQGPLEDRGPQLGLLAFGELFNCSRICRHVRSEMKSI
jgi:hypothetical protein